MTREDTDLERGLADISLGDVEPGKVVTRFPPEASGYMHIGHAKAVLLNEYFARKHGGTLIIRFDDTNPAKESEEYEQAILEDLDRLGIVGDKYSHTSDYFEDIYKYAEKLIDLGGAYVDDTGVEDMRKNRYAGLASTNRELTIEENKRIFQEMMDGKRDEYCLRAKISVDDPNKAMRDPVLMRCLEVEHPRTSRRVYPTYDFACPIVDSIEGVTHALRTSEYNDRNAQYEWILKRLGLRVPMIWDYSRLNFVYTLLSKRKLAMFVNEGLVQGWDDPRLPTIRGLLRRGMCVAALKKYVLMQGASRNTVLLEWDKIWTVNKKEIDPISPRYTALVKENLVIVKLMGKDVPCGVEERKVACHKKNADLGEKVVRYFGEIYLEQEDAKDIGENEEVTLMNWGNAIVTRIVRDEESGKVVEMEAMLNLEGDFKKTKKKLTWLSRIEENVRVYLHDYDYLITKRKLDEKDDVRDFLTEKTEYVTEAIGEPAILDMNPGQICQLERKGFYICDEKKEGVLKLIAIPDGKTKSIGKFGWNKREIGGIKG